MFQKWFFDLLEFLEQSHNPGVWTHWSVSEYTLVEVRDSPRPQECCNASPSPWVGNTAPEARRNRSCWFHAARFLATVPEDSEESAGGHGDFIHEHLIDDATPHTGFCRDHRGKLQSMWELCEDVASAVPRTK